MDTRLYLKIFLFLGLFISVGCSTSGGGGNSQPNQTVVNEDIQGITAYILNLASDIDNTSCAAFDASANTFPGVFPCTGNGDTTITIQSQTCNDGPPFDASLILNVALHNCSDEAGSTATGGFKIDFELNGDTGDAKVTSSNFEEDGISYTLDISGAMDNLGNVTCSGTATADGFDCVITSDCNSCLF